VFPCLGGQADHSKSMWSSTVRYMKVINQRTDRKHRGTIPRVPWTGPFGALSSELNRGLSSHTTCIDTEVGEEGKV